MPTKADVTRENAALIEENQEKSGKLAEIGVKLAENERFINEKMQEFSLLEEGMRELQIAIEDRGWTLLNGRNENADVTGLKLESIHKVSDDLRSHLVADALVKRITELRASYILGDAEKIEFNDRGNATSMIDNPANAKRLYSGAAITEIIRAQATDGNVVILANKSTRRVSRVPIQEIKAYIANPDDREDVWYIRREWYQTNTLTGREELVKAYYATDTKPSNVSRTYFESMGERVYVDKSQTAFVDTVNGQIGWPWGVPDLLASLQWAQKYSAYLKSQARFAEALSAIAVHYKTKTTRAQANAQSAVRSPGVAGTAVSGDMDIIQQKGSQDVNFDNGAPLAAAAAAAGEVSVIAALANPSAGGGSFSAAATLTPDLYKMVHSRRDHIARFINRITKFFGAKNPTIAWPALEDETTYRLAQSVLSMFNAGLLEPQDALDKLGEILDMKGSLTVPDGVLTPNNEKTLEANAKNGGASNADLGNTGGQGQSTGVGDSGQDGYDRNRADEPSNVNGSTGVS